MATYMIFIREGAIVDAEAMAAYQTGNRAGGAAASAMKPLVVYGAMETLEGEGADGMVILEFPDKDAARSHTHYQRLRGLRPFCSVRDGKA